MSRFGKVVTVSASGAAAGQVLDGVARNNQGLRILLGQAQPRGRDGAIIGSFVILDAGDNRHAPALAPLLHRPTDAAEVLAIIRQHSAGCVHVVNTNILALEPETPPAREGSPL
jgi:hypothetical protein